MVGMVLISVHILNPFRTLRSFRKLDTGMYINPEDGTSYTSQYQEPFLQSVENEHCAKHGLVLVIEPKSVPSNNLFPSATGTRTNQCSFASYGMSSDDGISLMPTSVAKMTPGGSDRAGCILATARLHLNPLPELPKNWRQVNPNLSDYHSDPMEISSTLKIPEITDWGCRQEEAHSHYADLPNVARIMLSIIPQGVGVEDSFSLGWDVVGWKQWITTGETLHENVVVRQFPRGNNGILLGDDAALHTTHTDNFSEMQRVAEDR